MRTQARTRLTSAGRRAPLAFLTALLVVVLAGCSLVSATIDIREIVEGQGVEHGNVSIETTNGETVLLVGYKSAATDEGAGLAEAGRIAEALWKEAPVGFDVLRLEPTGAGNLEHVTLQTADLEAEFGPRPEGAGGDVTGGLMRDLAIFGGIGLLLFIGFVVLIVMLVRRARRKRRQAYGGQYLAAPGTPAGPPPGAYPGQGSWPPSQPPLPPPPPPPPGPGSWQ